MKTVILCGGLGTRLSEETITKPKPMVQVGDKPILWHIMNHYSHFGFKEFTLALGYKGEVIKEYFLNYYALNNDIAVDLNTGEVKQLRRNQRDWKVDLIDTGDTTLTGGRLARLKEFLRPNGRFMLTYGDGLSDIDINQLVAFHKQHGRLATVTAVRPPARFGSIEIKEGQVFEFKEKPQMGEGWINGGFFVFETAVLEYFVGDDCILEREPLERLVADKQLMAFQHTGFWQCMDTLRDKVLLDDLWKSRNHKWKTYQPSGWQA